MKEFLSTDEVGERLGVSRQHVSRLVKRGDIPSIRSGRLIRVPVAAWDTWMAQQTADALASVREASAHV